MRRRTAHLVRSAKFLGRRAKQLIMVLADTIAMPAALWTALMLHAGTANSHLFDDREWLYAATVLFTVPAFVRLGLYRAVIRFLGIQAALAIAFGVMFSTIALVAINFFILGSSVPVSVFGIYFALAVLYVGASRFGARELLRMGNYARGASHHLWRRLCRCAAVFIAADQPAFPAGGVRRRQSRNRTARVSAACTYCRADNLLNCAAAAASDLVFLALPSASRRRRGEIIDR